jgi:hypothetical protein
MRYLTLTYYKKPNGQIDETLSVIKNLKLKDTQTASVILDFKTLKVLKASVNGQTIEKDWDTLVGYYHKHYAATIERMFAENGWEVVKGEVTEEVSSTDTDTQVENPSE